MASMVSMASKIGGSSCAGSLSLGPNSPSCLQSIRQNGWSAPHDIMSSGGGFRHQNIGPPSHNHHHHHQVHPGLKILLVFATLFKYLDKYCCQILHKTYSNVYFIPVMPRKAFLILM